MLSTELDSLCPTEQSHLAELETVIERGLKVFYEVGDALQTIRDKRYYRDTHQTFEEYCSNRWDMSRAHAYRLIASSEVVNNLSPIGDIPENEAQVRPLVGLTPEQQQEVWKEAVRTAPNGKVSAAHVSSVVDSYKLDEKDEEGGEGEEDSPQASTVSVHFSSESSEHYTPTNILDAVIECLRKIELDPCSNSHVNPNVPAMMHLTKEDNSLDCHVPWKARTVFMNPPYGKEVGKWVEKLCEEYEVGHVNEAIALVPARVDTAWFDRLADYPVCFIRGRLKFIGNENSAPFPSAVFYLGPNIDRFYYAFCPLGRVWQCIEPGLFGE